MWTAVVIVVLALSASTLARHHDDDHPSVKERVNRYRIRSQNLHIDDLEHHVDDLEHAMDNLSRPLTTWDVNSLKARVYKNEEHKCPDGEVSCGGDYPECISHLFVCDGRVDCHNGQDEVESVCDSEVVHVGSTYQGVLEWDSCEYLPAANVILTVTNSYHSPYFNNRVYVRATLVSDSTKFDRPHPVAIPMQGHYSFADGHLVLRPSSHTEHLHRPYVVTCTFNFGDHAHADCTVKEIASLHECAKFRIVKV